VSATIMFTLTVLPIEASHALISCRAKPREAWELWPFEAPDPVRESKAPMLIIVFEGV